MSQLLWPPFHHPCDNYDGSHLCRPNDTWWPLDVVPSPELILSNTMRGSVCLTTMSQQQSLSSRCLLRHMLTLPWILGRWFLSFRVEPHINTYVIAWCYGVLFLLSVPMWLPCSPIGAPPLGFAISQPFAVYSWQAYVPPDDGAWPTPEEHWVAVPPTASIRGEFHATHLAILKPFHQYDGAYSLFSMAELLNPYAFLIWQGEVFFS